MKELKVLLLIFASTLLFNSCKQEQTPSNQQDNKKEVPSLKSLFKDNFHIGAAIDADQIVGTDLKAIATIHKEFNSITPENQMKWMYIHPAPDTFNFEMSDKFVELGEQNDMYMVAHALVWHSQLAPWVEEIKDSTILMKHIENHINTIMKKYKGRIQAWDVVNEALNEDGTLRKSMFLEILGEGYLQKSFELAAAVDPDAELYYNDYNICQPEKRKGAIALIKKLQANNVKIDGVGIQAHWGINGPPLDIIEESIIEYANLGLKVMFTELDLTVLPNPWDLEGADVNQNFEGSELMNPYPESLPDSIQTRLGERYEEIFRLFEKHSDKISRVTFWGVNDEQTWLNNWPIKNRRNYPLLFDRNSEPKRAYHKVMSIKKEKKTEEAHKN